ncbi:MAG TPA: hypothetical protein VKA64_09835 [Gammaproteobacteria bacterium]|nr:hypothetical protein [Gammaproteobacteria bacterium]
MDGRQTASSGRSTAYAAARFMAREWVLFLRWLAFGLFVVPVFLDHGLGAVNLKDYYLRLRAGDVGPWLTFFVPYSAFHLWRIFRMQGAAG